MTSYNFEEAQRAAQFRAMAMQSERGNPVDEDQVVRWLQAQGDERAQYEAWDRVLKRARQK